jgi:hypothetical protein
MRDARGNTHTMVRRLGVMYVIWNRRMWSAWTGQWETFCVQRGEVQGAGLEAVPHPHNDHEHFSFSWPGARADHVWNLDLSLG